jgi:predicted dehydrogenase
VQAARAGKHVVVEKPLEITEKRAQAIIEACREADRRLFVVYQRRYSNAARQALSDIKAGRLGQVVLVNIVDNQFRHPTYYTKDAWRGTWALEGGGCVMTQSTHLIDLAQFVVGPIVRVFAQTKTAYHAIETEDVAVATLTFAGGALGTFSSSTAAFPGQRHLLTISGTRGSIIFNGEHDQIVFRQTVDGLPAAAIPSGFSFADLTDPRKYPTEGQRRQLQAVVNELCDHRASDSTGVNALRSVRVIDAIYRSAREGKPIEVERHTDLDVIGSPLNR